MFCKIGFSARLLLSSVVVLVVSLSLSRYDGHLRADDALRRAGLEPRITRLIENLGADEFALREKAQIELTRLGLDAFDALYRAQQHEDIEIAMRAQYLVRTIRIHWTQDHDPIEVNRTLRHYEKQSPTERVSRMQRLSSLPDWQGTEALCRLMRFENSNILSKRAALLLLQQPVPADAPRRAVLAQLIEHSVSLSHRPAADWVRTYARFLVDPESTIDRWNRLTQQEQEVFRQSPDHTRHEIVRDFLRWQVDMLSQLGREEAAVAVMKQTVELRKGSREDLLELVDWLMERSAWPVIDEVATKYQDKFHAYSPLLYRRAEAQLKHGQNDRAEKTALRALETEPEDRIVVALELQGRGLFDWSQREYQRVIDTKPDGSLLNIDARRRLAEMFHDQERELAAAEVLQPTVELFKTNAAVRGRMEKTGRKPESIISRMHFFFALHYASHGDRAKQIDHLLKGVESDPEDADILIAMYDVPDSDEAWRKTTDQRIKFAADKFRGIIGRVRELIDQQPSEANREQRAAFESYLATNYNQLAWLISNTRGDFHKALRSSQRSIELRPDDAGLLDTLARCYFALGDYKNAVKYQTKATRSDPFSGQIARQLKLFQDTLTKSEKEKNDP